MADDLLAQLQKRIDYDRRHYKPDPLLSEVAERIKALEAENARLREALEQFLSLIEYQYCGSREAMNALQEADNFACDALGEKQ